MKKTILLVSLTALGLSNSADAQNLIPLQTEKEIIAKKLIIE